MHYKYPGTTKIIIMVAGHAETRPSDDDGAGQLAASRTIYFNDGGSASHQVRISTWQEVDAPSFIEADAPHVDGDVVTIFLRKP